MFIYPLYFSSFFKTKIDCTYCQHCTYCTINETDCSVWTTLTSPPSISRVKSALLHGLCIVWSVRSCVAETGLTYVSTFKFTHLSEGKRQTVKLKHNIIVSYALHHTSPHASCKLRAYVYVCFIKFSKCDKSHLHIQNTRWYFSTESTKQITKSTSL